MPIIKLFTWKMNLLKLSSFSHVCNKLSKAGDITSTTKTVVELNLDSIRLHTGIIKHFRMVEKRSIQTTLKHLSLFYKILNIFKLKQAFFLRLNYQSNLKIEVNKKG
ncbi:hypothetical protein BpHYR1_052328 [Brachionus plicatilis]|uniref:Uncharacterized protein n=1 Tax=Brachionus plicatilis TaxID=10195 RepID=A0A3M7T339_BRAPC|nr:hypothetical protein BpHYR1_052328 [Brachionus plicatilis]